MMKFSGKYIPLLLLCIPGWFCVPDVSTAALEEQGARIRLFGPASQSTTVYALHTRGTQYVSIQELAKFFNCRLYENTTHGKIEIYPEQRRIKVTRDNPFVVIDEAMFQLRHDVLGIRGTLYVPIREFLPLLDHRLSGRYTFEPAPGNLAIPSGNNLITGLTEERKTNGTLLRLRAHRDLGQPSHYFDRNNWLYIQVPDGRVNPETFTIPPATPLIRETRVEQLANMATIAVRLGQKVGVPQVWQDSRSKDILISLPLPPDVPTPTVSLADLLRSQQRNWDFDVIVLDAGHGGKDPGTSVGRIREKDIALDVVRRLGKLLEQQTSHKVVYTRTSDTFLSLIGRTRLANEGKGKIFISIHVNSARNQSARGIETYILSPGRRDAEAQETARRENQVALAFEDNPSVYAEMTEAQLMKTNIMEDGFLRESENLASLINANLRKTTKAQIRGVKQGLFWVLVNASMPRVLVEIGYISNSRERKNLSSPSYRQKVAEGLLNGILEFVRIHRRIIAENPSRRPAQ